MEYCNYHYLYYYMILYIHYCNLVINTCCIALAFLSHTAQQLTTANTTPSFLPSAEWGGRHAASHHNAYYRAALLANLFGATSLLGTTTQRTNTEDKRRQNARREIQERTVYIQHTNQARQICHPTQHFQGDAETQTLNHQAKTRRCWNITPRTRPVCN